MNSRSSRSEHRSSRQSKAIHVGEKRYQLVFENSSIGIAVIGLDFHIEQANASLAKLLAGIHRN
jgi:PAS domain-containing protein